MFVDERALTAAVAETAEQIKALNPSQALPKTFSFNVTLVVGEPEQAGDVPMRSPHIEHSLAFERRSKEPARVTAFVQRQMPDVIRSMLLYSSGLPQGRRRELAVRPIQVNVAHTPFDPSRHTPPQIPSGRHFPGVL